MNAPAAIFISPRRKNHSPPRQYSTAPLDIPKYHTPIVPAAPRCVAWHNKAIFLPIQSTSHRGGVVSTPQYYESNTNPTRNECEIEIPLSGQTHPSAANPVNYLDSRRNCPTRSPYSPFPTTMDTIRPFTVSPRPQLTSLTSQISTQQL